MNLPDVTARSLLIASLIGYGAAGLRFATGRVRQGHLVFGLAWLCNAATLIFNWLACGQPPFGNMYHVLVALALCFLPAYAYLWLGRGFVWMGASFAFASLVPLLGTLFMHRDLFWRRMPALQSPWFVPHVMAYMMAYALATVGFALVCRTWRAARRNDPVVADLQQGLDAVTRLAFPFMTFGLLSGALWADQAWGRFWSWDSKETWALIMWLGYALYFHCRASKDLRRYAPACQVAGFAALIVTFLCVSLVPRLGSILHTYAR